MNTLKGEHIYLRALEPSDLDFLYKLENDETTWEVSNTFAPYSKYVLKQYLDNAHLDIFEVKQLRLVVCVAETDSAVGFVDLFEFDPKHRRVGVGIIIFARKDRQKGYASEALKLLLSYVFANLGVHQVFANITRDNEASIRLFEKLGFQLSGEKKDWIYVAGNYKDELFYQCLNEET